PVANVGVPKETLPTSSAEASWGDRGFSDVEAFASPENILECQPYNGFLMAAHHAYQDHYPLSLSPDHIWLCISQGLGTHINLNAEELRSRLVSHEGKLKLTVRRDNFVLGSPDNDWSGVVSEFSEQLGEHLGGCVIAHENLPKSLIAYHNFVGIFFLDTSR
ncbi:MAG: DUF4419 domain-containing protein, partial [Candidatus Altiarchaeales archaeon]|nr:DUF4419 domain-containing protein [Candidatus Altiarchaeales archaeon]